MPLPQRVLYTEKYLRALVNTANTVEFEWTRQYYVQGAKHRETHLYWEGAMQDLVEMWRDMNKKIVLTLGVLRDAAGRFQDNVKCVGMNMYICVPATTCECGLYTCI